MFKRLGLVAGIAAGALLASAASATTFTVSFTGADESATAKNYLDYTASKDGQTLAVDAYGAHINTNSTVTYATVQTWAGAGMGVLFGTDTTKNGTHQIDNVGAGTDFVILTFDQAVTLDAIDRVAYGIRNVGSYSDASYAAYNGAATAISSLSTSSFSSLAQGTSVTGDTVYSKVWLVAADVNGSTDGFKLTSITASTIPSTVPEAATWAMMVVGFGAMGGALRRRRSEHGMTFVA